MNLNSLREESVDCENLWTIAWDGEQLRIESIMVGNHGVLTFRCNGRSLLQSKRIFLPLFAIVIIVVVFQIHLLQVTRSGRSRWGSYQKRKQITGGS